MSTIKNLGESFSAMRTITLASLGSTVATMVLAGVLVAYAFGSVGQRVYVVGSSGTQPANAFNPDEHSQFELRNLVRTWAGYMFAHDQFTYKDNLNAALPLIDDMGGRQIYEGFKKGGVYDNYLKYGSRTTINIDSIVIGMDTYPRTGKLYLRQRTFLGDRQSEPAGLACSFRLSETHRSDRNPFGVMITNFHYLPYDIRLSKSEQLILKEQKARDAKDLEAAKAEGKQAADPAALP